MKKIGDHHHMVSDRTGASVASATTFNGEHDVHYLRIGSHDREGNGVAQGSTIPK